MGKKTVGVKKLQAKLANSFPKEGEITIVTKRNVPMYAISNVNSVYASQSLSGELSLNTSEINVCPTCGQKIGGEENEDS
jgi:hypothetical protein